MDNSSLFNPPDDLLEYSWRPVGRRDIPAILALTTSAENIDKTGGTPSKERLLQIFDILGNRAETDAIGAETAEGEIAGLGFIFFSPSEEEHLALMDGITAVEHRGRGLGSAVLDWMESRVRNEFDKYDDDLPKVMRLSCDDHLTDRIDLFKQHGFKAARYAYEMKRDLKEPVRQAPLPEGIRLAKWSETNDPALMAAFNEAFKENWGLHHVNDELWKMLFTQVPQFRGDLTYLAYDGDAVVGFCLNWVDAAKNDATGVKEGWVEAIGVIPSWRGRGLASALMTKSLDDFVVEGLERAGLDVDTQNPTGALGLYEKMGFKAVKRMIVFTKK